MEEINSNSAFWANKRQALKTYISCFINLHIKCSLLSRNLRSRNKKYWKKKKKGIISVLFQYFSSRSVLVGDVISKIDNFILKKAGVAVGKT